MFFKFITLLVALTVFAQATVFEQIGVGVDLHNPHIACETATPDNSDHDGSAEDCQDHHSHCHSHCLFIVFLGNFKNATQITEVDLFTGRESSKLEGFFKALFRPPLV